MTRGFWEWRVLFALLTLGFCYSAVGSAREYLRVFGNEPALGPEASIENLAAPLEVRPSTFRSEVRRGGSGDDRALLMRTIASPLHPDEVRRAHYVVSYLLFPRQVWLEPSCEASEKDCSELDADVLLLGGEAAPDLGRSRTLSPILSLVTTRR